jgi:thimet oligopeptidase
MDAGLNAEGSKCEEKLGQYYVNILTRRDLYQILSAQKGRNAAEKRLLVKTLEAFELNGLKLSDDKLAQVKQLRSELAAKEAKFASNNNNDKTIVTFADAELAGVPDSFIKSLSRDADGKLIVNTKSTSYTAVMENASIPETRRKMLFAYVNRGGPDNTKLLEEALALRAQIAKVMGYQTWADYRTSTRMAKDKKTVLDFLASLKDKLAARNKADMDQLLKFKKELDPQATTLDQWDIAYMSRQLQVRDFQVDGEKIREYFPNDVVVAGMFQVYSKLLGVTYHEVKGSKVWSPDVKLYQIRDAKDNKLIAYFYADFFPRQGKYGHAAAFPLISGRKLASGKYSVPVASIVSNMSPATGGRPSLASHSEVETLFHEFGHIMHQTLTRAPYASLSGSSTAQDFVEAPSQMLENWVWDPTILAMLSGHYQDTTQKLPKAMLDKMIAARDFGQGYYYTRQLLFGLFDMTIHTQNAVGGVDVTKTYDDLYRQIIRQEPIAGGHFPASFGHMMGGYDAAYYGYLWSKVYAEDMFSTFPPKDLMDPAVGMKYRRTILEQGAMIEPLDLLKKFLGRDPSPEAFFKKLGIQQ